MTRVNIIKVAVLLLFIGLACGLIGQVELMKPRVSFLSETLWPQLLALHIWATAISLLVICLSTISLIRDKTTIGQWAIWFGFALVPILFGVLINLVLANAQSPDNFLTDTVYVTANRHAFGTAGLLFALGGLSAFQRVEFEGLSLRVSFSFALLISGSGVALAFLQSIAGLNGMARRYIDYPDVFAPILFYSSIAAIACFVLSAVYIILLWRHSYKKLSKIEEVL